VGRRRSDIGARRKQGCEEEEAAAEEEVAEEEEELTTLCWTTVVPTRVVGPIAPAQVPDMSPTVVRYERPRRMRDLSATHPACAATYGDSAATLLAFTSRHLCLLRHFEALKRLLIGCRKSVAAVDGQPAPAN